MNVGLIKKSAISGKSDWLNAEVTDLAVLLGGDTERGNKEKQKTKKMSVWNYSVTGDDDDENIYFNGSTGSIEHIYAPEPLIVQTDGSIDDLIHPYTDRSVPYRFTMAKPLFSNKTQIGAYPQTAAEEDTARELETAYANGTLKRTGHAYTFDSYYIDGGRSSYDPESRHVFGFKPFTAREYIHTDGNKYIRLKARKNFHIKAIKSKSAEPESGYEKMWEFHPGTSYYVREYCYIAKPEDDYTLSNGEHIDSTKYYWVKVEPIEWLTAGTRLITKKCLLAGMRYADAVPYINIDDRHNNYKVSGYLKNYFNYEADGQKPPKGWTDVTDPEIRETTLTPAPQMPAPTETAGKHKFCSHCGTPLEAAAKFCVNCGAPV